MFSLATASIASAALFVGFRERFATSVYFIIPAIMITKLYAVTIVATFNNRLNAIGGPPPPTDVETYFEDANKHYSRNNLDVPAKEIRIGRTVVQQVWKDDVPMSHLKVSFLSFFYFISATFLMKISARALTDV